MKGQLNIEAMFAYLVRDDDGTEGLVGVLGTAGWLPLVGADMDKMRALQPRVQEIANATRKTVELVKFEKREHVATFEPNRLSTEKSVRLPDDTIGIL